MNSARPAAPSAGVMARRFITWTIAACLTAILLWFAEGAIRTWKAAALVAHVQASNRISARSAEQQLRQARHLRPDLSQPWRISARLAEFQHPLRAHRYIRQAIRLSPHNWRNWHTLGMIDYQLQRIAAAQHALHMAAVYNNGFAAHFAAANLAFILHDPAMFWREMKTALRIAPAFDVNPALQDLVRLGGSHSRHLLAVLPPHRTRIAAAAIHYLVQTGQLHAAQRIWNRMTCPAYRRKICRQASLILIRGWRDFALAGHPAVAGTAGSKSRHSRADRQAAAALFQSARDWNTIVRRAWMRAGAVHWGRITDGRFRHPWVGIYGWHSYQPAVRILPARIAELGNELEFTFSGEQASQVPLFRQWVIVHAHADYTLAFQSRARQAVSKSGILARIQDAHGKSIARVTARLGTSWTWNYCTIHIPARIFIVKVAVIYRRPHGHSLFRGTALIRRFIMTAAPENKAHALSGITNANHAQ